MVEDVEVYLVEEENYFENTKTITKQKQNKNKTQTKHKQNKY